MNFVTYVDRWFQGRRDRLARALPADFNDVVDLYKKGVISAIGTGQSITDISAEIQSRVGVPLKVSVAHGTYFVSRGNHQNMVTRRKYQFDLEPQATRRIRVPASCINASLPVPGERDRFRGFHAFPRTCESLEAAEGEDAMVIQAGVWALTDGYSRAQIQRTLRTRRVRYGITWA